jgi:thiamine-monophosphate kinase
MTEFELLAQLLPSLPQNRSVVLGPGHDCAALDLGAPDLVLFKTDAVVEGIHFTPETPPEKIGRKALARALSDIAASAGKPVAALISISLPKPLDPAWVEQLYRGINELAHQFGVAIVGGETTASPGPVFISVSLLGTSPRSRIISRAGAKAGDAIFVTGELGGSRAGKHLDFVPRLHEADWLASNFQIHAMMDVSDGLAGDLRHILTQSHAGAELHSSAIPISKPAKLLARAESSAKPPLAAALTDGEDFELLFTLAASDAVSLLDAWKIRFPELRLTCIGKITAEPGLRLRDKDGIRNLAAHGYTHFKNS